MADKEKINIVLANCSELFLQAIQYSAPGSDYWI